MRRRIGLRCCSGAGFVNATARCSIGLRVVARREVPLAAGKAGQAASLAVVPKAVLCGRFASPESCAVDFAARRVRQVMEMLVLN